MDSIKSMMIICEFGKKPTEKVTKYAQEKQNKGLHFHPIIIIMKDIKGKPYKFLLWYNKTTLVIPDFITALRTLMQLYFVLNFEYPAESNHVCNFLSHYFFEIALTKIPGLTAINNLMDLLK